MTLFELEAILSLDTRGFETSVSTATAESSSLAKAIGADADTIQKSLSTAFSFTVGDLMADGIRAAGSAMWGAAKDGVTYASSLEEVQNVVDVTFGENAQRINAWARTTQDAFGIGELSAKTYASQIGSILAPETRGFNAEEIYEMSTALTELTGDIASFRNMSFSEVFDILMSGLRGETESIERLGIDMRVSSLAAFAGVSADDFTKMSDYDQTMTRYQYIMQNTSDAQGDFMRTQSGYANQMRVLEENIITLESTLGTRLLPVLTDVVTWFNTLFAGSEDGAEMIDGIGESMAETYATISTTAANALALVDALAEMEAQGIDNAEEQSVWNGLLQELSGTLPEISGLIDTTTGSINGGTDALKAYVQEWQSMQREMAISAALQEAQNVLLAEQQELASLQWELKIASLTGKDFEARETEIYDMFRNYLREEHGWTDRELAMGAWVDSELMDMAKDENPFALAIVGMLEDLYSGADNVEALRDQVMAQELEVDAAQARLTAMESTLGYMMGESGVESKAAQGAESDQALAAAVKDALALKQEPPNVTVEVYMNADTTPLVTEVVRVVTREIKQKAM